MPATLGTSQLFHNKLLTNSSHLITGGHLLIVTTASKHSALLECSDLDKRSYLLIRGTQINVEGFMGNPSFDLNSLLM